MQVRGMGRGGAGAGRLGLLGLSRWRVLGLRSCWCACPCPSRPVHSPTQYTLPPEAGCRGHHPAYGQPRVCAPHHPAAALLPPCPSSSPATRTLAHTYTLESYRGATPAQPGYCLIVQRNTGALLGPLRPTLFPVLGVVRRVYPFLNQVLQQAVRKCAPLQGRNVLSECRRSRPHRARGALLVGSGARPPERLRGSARRVARGPFRLAPGRRRPGEMG